MGNHFFYHFLEDGERRSRKVQDEYSNMCAAQGLVSIVKSGYIKGNNKKGYFKNLSKLPNTVSFSAAELSELDVFERERSPFSIAFFRNNDCFSSAKPVEYLTEYQIYYRSKRLDDKEKPFIDLFRPSCYERTSIIEGLPCYYPRYDYRWEKEFRLICDKFEFSKEDIAFLTVINDADVKAINDKLGLEALNLPEFNGRVAFYRQNGLKSNLFEGFFKYKMDKHKKPNAFVLQEVVEEVHEEMKEAIMKKKKVS
jgi:hypothetical protein